MPLACCRTPLGRPSRAMAPATALRALAQLPVALQPHPRCASVLLVPSPVVQVLVSFWEST